MLRVVGEAMRIDRALLRLQDTLKGIPSRGVRLTRRGGELRTTIHWGPQSCLLRALGRYALSYHSGRIGCTSRRQSSVGEPPAVADGRPLALPMAVDSLALASARDGAGVQSILVTQALSGDGHNALLPPLLFAWIRVRLRGARAVFDGLDDALG
ncbi:hypothetical protein BH10PSE14_BH10PSE14_23440 [soil metagenome]